MNFPHDVWIEVLVTIGHNGWYMKSFGISEHLPVKPLQILLNVTTLNLALSAKCFIYIVSGWCILTFKDK